jgi:hypothetical protein
MFDMTWPDQFKEAVQASFDATRQVTELLAIFIWCEEKFVKLRWPLLQSSQVTYTLQEVIQETETVGNSMKQYLSK